ncbi:alpha-ketoacid dehydrogenase subunit beta [Sphingopyxis terrae]|uniref:alpha-ketoacid dehydrogenase subunit beta n=1 Tax=Sphingopyxis terrae TaxID=33052 RepID=UPI002A16F652|nr:pyruvate dehydrogenase complex E1 component subunit beta [Sphingopyxis terrae]MDX8356407.1 pyruvate dehydrogenase complex E1 component subunit beta [Sphingopyxis terrae]
MSEINIIQALNRALTDAMADDDKVLVLGEDIADPEGGGVAKITSGLSSRFGEARVKSTPISEQAIIGAAIGAAITGYKPVAEIMLMNFMTVAMDMIVNHAAKLRYMSGGQTGVPIVIRTMTGAGIAAGGQHSDYLESWFAHTAGLKIVAPSRPDDAYGLLRACIDDPDPCIFIENLLSYRTMSAAPEPGHRVPLGKAAIRCEGADVTIVSYSRMVIEAAAAAKIAAEQGVSCEVIDLRTIAPWDRDCVLSSARKTGRVIVAHEAVRQYGVGAEIASTITEELFRDLKQPVMRLGAAYAPVPFSRPLELAHAPDRQRIADAAVALARSA